MKHTNQIQYLLNDKYSCPILTAGFREAAFTVKEAIKSIALFHKKQELKAKEAGIQGSPLYYQSEYILYKITPIKTYTVKELLDANI